MQQFDEFSTEDIDDEKTISFIKDNLPQELKGKFSDDELYYFLDTIYDYYDKSGVLDSNPDSDGFIDIDIDAIAKYVSKEAKKDGIGDFDSDDLFFIVESELAYAGVFEDEADEEDEETSSKN